MVLAMVCLTINAQQEDHKQSKKSLNTASCCETECHCGSKIKAPISVMGSHTHGKDGWMVSYRYMNMQMKDLRQGTDDVSNSDGHDAGYMMIPLEMSMDMHMVGVMYTPSDKLTLMSMFNFIGNSMDMQMRMMNGMTSESSMSSSSFGDVKISGIYSFQKSMKKSLHGQLGFSLPTGSINQKDVGAMSNGNEVILPYPMQIGSGTFDTDFAITYVGNRSTFSWGHQLKTTLRFGENSNDYRLGNQYGLDNWLAVKLVDWLSVSGRVEGLIIDKISGANPDLNPMMSLTADTVNSGGTFVNGGIGLNSYLFDSLQVAVEYELPLHQDLNGIQLKQQNAIMLGATYGF